MTACQRWKPRHAPDGQLMTDLRMMFRAGDEACWRAVGEASQEPVRGGLSGSVAGGDGDRGQLLLDFRLPAGLTC